MSTDPSPINIAGVLLALQSIPKYISIGKIPRVDKPLLISQKRRSDLVIWHSFGNLEKDKEVEEELICQSESLCCPEK